MGIGPRIKEYRIKCGYTQKDLADKLNVTFQAVSRWENNDVQPSFDTVKEMAKLFNCTIDELFGVEHEEKVEIKEEPKQEEVKVVERVVQVLGICHDCHKEIKDYSDLKKVDIEHTTMSGRHHVTKHETFVICANCKKKRDEAEARKRKAERERELAKIKSLRIHSFIWPSIASAILITISILYFVKYNDSLSGGILLACGILAFPFLGCWILFNNPVPGIWLTISRWSIKFPGVIFTLDLEGIFFLITVKILFGLISIFISFWAVVFATAVGMVISLFVYPYALYNNIKGKELLV